MTTDKIFRVGLLFYSISFFLIAAKETQPSLGGLPPIGCFLAVEAFVYPLMIAYGRLHGWNSMPDLGPYICVLLSGWVNPSFVLAVLFAQMDILPQLGRWLRFLTLSLIPFTALALYRFPMLPREGYFLWVIGILLVLFSNRFVQDQSVNSIGPASQRRIHGYGFRS